MQRGEEIEGQNRLKTLNSAVQILTSTCSTWLSNSVISDDATSRRPGLDSNSFNQPTNTLCFCLKSRQVSSLLSMVSLCFWTARHVFSHRCFNWINFASTSPRVPESTLEFWSSVSAKRWAHRNSSLYLSLLV